MAKLSKRAQLEAMGWKFTVIPRLVREGLIRDSSTGYVSPAYYDHTHPDGWQVTPPADFPCEPRRFEGRSPNPAVRWAYEQAAAPRLKAELTGVGALIALMGEARASGMVADGVDETAIVPVRPDAELLSLCREVLGCDRLAEEIRGAEGPCPWTEKEAFRGSMNRLMDATRSKDRIMPRIIELKPTTSGGAVAKARAIETLFGNSRGLKAGAVLSLVADLVAVFGGGENGRRYGAA